MTFPATLFLRSFKIEKRRIFFDIELRGQWMHKRVGLVPLWRSPLKYWGWILTASDFKATEEVVVAVEAAKWAAQEV